jgi:hypothetical protein
LHRLCSHFASSAGQKTAQNLVVEHKGMSNADHGLWVGLVWFLGFTPSVKIGSLVGRLFDGHFATHDGPRIRSMELWVAPS